MATTAAPLRPLVLPAPAAPEPARLRGPRADGVTLQVTHAGFARRLDFEAWRTLGPKLANRASAAQWWLGDWLVFGREKYGRQYATALEETGLSYQTLRNYAVVARRFAPARRWAALSFQHHAELCGLPDAHQDELLARAAQAGWTRSQLRDAVRAGRAPAPPRASLRLRPTRDQLDRWAAAADLAGMAPGRWAAAQVDAAAAQLLGDVSG